MGMGMGMGKRVGIVISVVISPVVSILKALAVRNTLAAAVGITGDSHNVNLEGDSIGSRLMPERRVDIVSSL